MFLFTHGIDIVDGKEVNAGEDFMISVKVKDVKAENVGFVVGTMGDNYASHLMFDWRKNDVYIWRDQPYGWKGHKDGIFSCSVSRDGEHTMTLVCKSGTYYMYIDDVKVCTAPANTDNGWGGKLDVGATIGTTGTVKTGITCSHGTGTATFSDFTLTTDAAAINALLAK